MAAGRPRVPRTQSVEASLRRFFAENPYEELSVDDAKAKLGRKSTVVNVLGQLTSEGLLERVSVYRLKARE